MRFSDFKTAAKDVLLEKTLRVEMGVEVRVLENPNLLSVLTFLERSYEQELRGLISGPNIYWWDSYDATHSDMARQLGIEPPYHELYIAQDMNSQPNLILRDDARHMTHPQILRLYGPSSPMTLPVARQVSPKGFLDADEVRAHYGKAPLLEKAFQIYIDNSRLRVLENPVLRDLVLYYEQSREKELRGLLVGSTIYWWDAYYATHRNIAGQIGAPRPYKELFLSPRGMDDKPTLLRADEVIDHPQIWGLFNPGSPIQLLGLTTGIIDADAVRMRYGKRKSDIKEAMAPRLYHGTTLPRLGQIFACDCLKVSVPPPETGSVTPRLSLSRQPQATFIDRPAVLVLNAERIRQRHRLELRYGDSQFAAKVAAANPDDYAALTPRRETEESLLQDLSSLHKYIDMLVVNEYVWDTIKKHVRAKSKSDVFDVFAIFNYLKQHKIPVLATDLTNPGWQVTADKKAQRWGQIII